MEFGRVPAHLWKDIDFSLPEDPAWNMGLLPGLPHQSLKLYLGCPKWTVKSWLGKIYPDKTKEKDFLASYVRHFNSIELNATHYKVYEERTIQKWAAAAQGSDFLFCPKMYQEITHRGDLRNNIQLTEIFLQPLRAFKDHLGPILIQLSEYFSPDRQVELMKYLSALPADLQFFLELRHPAWFQNLAAFENFLTQIQKLNIGMVITDTAGRRDCAHMYLSIPKVFVRFVSNSLDPSDYTRLDEWVQRLKYWSEQGLEAAYFFIHMEEEEMSPELSVYFSGRLNEVLGTNIPMPVFIEKNTLF